jgi:hypothetical protein
MLIYIHIGILEEDREKEVCFHTLLWALPALLRHLPLDQIILAIGKSLCVCIYMYVYIYIMWTFVYIFIFAFVYFYKISSFESTHLGLYMNLHVYVGKLCINCTIGDAYYIYIHMHTQIYTYTYIYVCIHTHTYIHIYLYTYIYKFIWI